MKYLYLFLTLFFTIYGQLIIKWRVDYFAKSGLIAIENNPLNYYFKVLLDIYVISGLAAAFVASLFWIATLNKFELSYAYPFMSLAPAIVLFFSIYIFNETFTLGKLIGLLFIIVGLIITVKVK